MKTTTTTMILMGALGMTLGLVGCDETDPVTAETMDISLAVHAKVGMLDASCATAYTDLGATDVTANIADARFYMSGLEFRDASGAWTALTLAASDWQNDGIALLDFEDGTGTCSDSGTPETNGAITGTLPKGEYDRVRFNLGLPHAMNHLDSANAPAPLNTPGMFWVWKTGYKFMRVDWLVAGTTPKRWNLHLGSGGCEAPTPADVPTTACARPNLPTIELAFNPHHDTLKFDLAALVANADLSANTVDSPPGCMSAPLEPNDCGPVFEAIGIAFDTGACLDGCEKQTVFSAMAHGQHQ